MTIDGATHHAKSRDMMILLITEKNLLYSKEVVVCNAMLIMIIFYDKELYEILSTFEVDTIYSTKVFWKLHFI